MRPSAPGVAVTKPCAGGAAFTPRMGSETPIIKIKSNKKLIKKGYRFFIGGDYIRIVMATSWSPLQ
jgi:hypothetical protein